MAVTILEALQNANYNLQASQHPLMVAMAKEQLKNATTLLEKGYPISQEVEPLLEAWGDVDAVPECGLQDEYFPEPLERGEPAHYGDPD